MQCVHHDSVAGIHAMYLNVIVENPEVQISYAMDCYRLLPHAEVADICCIGYSNANDSRNVSSGAGVVASRICRMSRQPAITVPACGKPSGTSIHSSESVPHITAVTTLTRKMLTTIHQISPWTEHGCLHQEISHISLDQDIQETNFVRHRDGTCIVPRSPNTCPDGK